MKMSMRVLPAKGRPMPVAEPGDFPAVRGGVDGRLVKLIQKHGGRITVRGVQQLSRSWRPTGVAEVALRKLARQGMGFWMPFSRGSAGRPTRFFQLHPKGKWPKQ